MPQFVVHAHRSNGDEYPPFLVTAQDEVSATKMVQRKWLTIDSVRDYLPREGQPTPVVMKFGPPVSDTTFEQDYHNRPADKPADDGQANTKDDLSVGERGLFNMTYYLWSGWLPRWW